MFVLECQHCYSRDFVKSRYGTTFKGAMECYLRCRKCEQLISISGAIANEVEDVMELSNDYWVSKDGKRYDFEDMSANYLKNCIELLKRSYNVDKLKDSNLFVGLTQEYMLR